jgi:hypothetical protein
MSLLITYIEESLIVILPLLGSIAFMTLAERKVMGLYNKKNKMLYLKQSRSYSTYINTNNERKIPSFIYDEVTGCIESKFFQEFSLLNLDLSNFSITPVKIFTDACKDKFYIINQYKNVCGVQL